MSLFSTLRVGASGLGVASTGLSVTGDNIANVSTIGYKGSRASFSDMLTQDVFGMGGMSKLGTGAATSTISTVWGQGSIAASGNALDMAISGDGFFAVADGKQMSYTRDGEFFLDGNGFLTNASGMNLQGYNAIGGTIVPQLTDLQIDSAGVPGSATANITLDAMLSADTEPGSDLAGMDFYGTGSGTNTFEDAVNAADYSTSTTVYDSLGVGHDVTILFERQDDNTWQYRAITDATSVYDSSGNAFATDSGAAFEIASGTVDFGTDGAISAFTPDAASSTTWTFLGADPTDLNFDFGMDSSGNVTSGALTMSGSESTVSSITQDGYGPGSLTGVEVQPDGTILGSYTNGQQATLGQVTLATFASEAGLERQGGSMYTAGLNSGLPTFGQPGSGSFGSISGNSLEQSNVDLETELVGMITYQRTYQANAKVVSAANETLQSLVNML